MMVFDSADLDRAAHDAVDYSLSNTGQVCCSVERVERCRIGVRFFLSDSLGKVFTGVQDGKWYGHGIVRWSVGFPNTTQVR